MADPIAIARVEILERHFPDCVEPLEPVAYGARALAYRASQVILKTGKNPIPTNMKAVWGEEKTEFWKEIISPCLKDEELAVRASKVAEELAKSEISLTQ